MTSFTSFAELLSASNLSMLRLSDLLGIPYRTLQNWKAGKREAPDYVIKLIAYYLRSEGYLKTDL